VTRRGFLRGAVGVSSALLIPPSLVSALAACGGTSTESGSKQIVFLTWPGRSLKIFHDAFEVPYTKRTGYAVKDIYPFDYGKFQTAIQSGNPEGYDVAWFADDAQPYRAFKAGLIEELDYSLIPRAKQGIEAVRLPYAVSPYITAYQFWYRSDVYKNRPPQSWADFFDTTNYPGPRSLGSWVGGVFEAALMADGVDPQNLYPLDVPRALKVLNRLKPSIRAFHDSYGVDAGQMIHQKDVTMVLTWSSLFLAQKAAGEPVRQVWQGGFYFSPAMGIVKGTKHREQAYAFLDQMFDLDGQVQFAKEYITSPSIPAATAQIPSSLLQEVSLGHIADMVHLNPPYYADKEATIQQQYDAWRAK